MKIIIYCGDSWESWSPMSVLTGVGGSEEAVINIAFHLAILGHEVVVYNKCDDMAGPYKVPKSSYFLAVTYKDYLDYDGEECDIFIGWRNVNTWKVAQNYKIGYHWLHDTTPETQVLSAIDMGASKVMVLSRYHRRLYPNLRNEHIFLTQNGVDVTLFDKKVKRIPHSLFWGSSYDRGLVDLLEHVWPQVKLAVPEATLRIAYGYQTMAKIMGEDSQKFITFKENLEELMNQEGVTHLGRISHEEVAKETLAADVWAYPTWYPEISCINAMKAQIGGAIPVVIPTAAVAETVVEGFKTDRGFYQSITGSVVQPSEVLEQFTKLLITTLTSPEEAKEQMRTRMMESSKKLFSWEKVAKDWESEFTEALYEK